MYYIDYSTVSLWSISTAKLTLTVNWVLKSTDWTIWSCCSIKLYCYIKLLFLTIQIQKVKTKSTKIIIKANKQNMGLSFLSIRKSNPS